MINDETKEAALTRLKKIGGQVKGLMRMVEDEEYCIDMCNQINAIRRALEGVALIIMKRHVESCVAHAIHEDGGKEKVDELLATIDRFIR